MSLAKAVQFRQLSAQLTQPETKHFFNKLANDANNNNMVNAALFQFFIKSPAVNSINNLLTNIIRNRKKKPTTITTQNIKLDQLPKQVIGVTASFMKQYDYINFSKSNRSMFLGCNSPNLMQELQITEIQNYSSINLQSFRFLKTLRIDLNRFNELKINKQINVMNEVNKIELDGAAKSDIDINAFMTQNFINVRNVTTLILYNFGTAQNSFNSDKFNKLFTKFPKTQYCSFMTMPIDIDANKIRTIWPHLRGLQLIETQTSRLLLNAFGNKLDFLGFMQVAKNTDYNVSNIDFCRLQQLRLHTPTNKFINDILKTAVNLKKIYICSTMGTSEGLSSFLTAKETNETIIKLMVTCKYLQYMEFRDDGRLFESILVGIEKGLFQTKKRKRTQMKIKIHISVHRQKFEPMTFMLNIGNVIHWLQMSEIKDFMFILIFNNKSTALIFNGNAVLQEFKNVSSNINVIAYNGKSIFVIANKNCQINGYHESWKLKGDVN